MSGSRIEAIFDNGKLKKINYDESIIRQAASTLYAHATMVTYFWGAGGFFLGVFLGWATDGFHWDVDFKMCVFSLMGAGTGVSIGKYKALWIKLEAQSALCLAKIEENTGSSNHQSE